MNPTETDRIAGIEERLGRIEGRLDRLLGLLDQAPDLVAMAADTADEAVARAQARGIDIDARAQATLQLVEDATAPDTLAAASRLVQRLEDLEPALALVASLEDTLGMVADTVDAWAARQAAAGIDLDGRAQAMGRMLEALTSPATAEAAERLLQRMPDLEAALDLAAGINEMTAMLVDAFDEQARRLQARNIDIDARVADTNQLVLRLTDPGLLQQLADVVGALEEASSQPAQPLGAWALLRSFSDPEVQRTAGFAVALARRLGPRLPTS